MEITKSKKNIRAKSETTLDIEDVILLGGDQSDIEFLKDVDDDDEIELQDDDSDGETLKNSEVRDFIAKLGFQKVSKTILTDQQAEIGEKLLEDPQVENGKQSKQTLKREKTKNASIENAPLKKASVCEVVNVNRIQSYHMRSCLLLKPGVKWTDYQITSDPVATTSFPKDIIQKLEDFGSRVMKDEVAVYRKQQEASKKSSVGWLKTVLTSGTQSDKMAALVLQVQEAPIHNLSCLDSLIAMVKKKSRRESLQVLDALKELFVSDLLPENNKLKAFDQHPWSDLDQLSSGNKDTYDKRVLIWYFESELKQKYLEFVTVLETLSHDAVEAVRKKSLNVILHLLCERPEQEKKLLSMLVNKLGDPDYKIAANASHLLSQLMARHPVMKTVVVSELERLLYRPNISPKAQYYGVCFLNQLMLSEDEKQLALRLLTIYFSFFKVFVKKGEVESKILSALLTGVNRAYPYAKPDKESIMTQVDTLYKIVHISQFNTSVQALMLIYQVIDVSDSTSDRYFVALYRKLRDPSLQTSTKLTMFLNLLFKSLKSDVLEKRVHAFVKRLLQVSQYFSPPFICAALYMLSELLKSRPKLMVLNKVYSKFDASVDEDEEEHFVDVLDENNESSSVDKTDSKVVPVASSWVHRKQSNSSSKGTYDPHHRNPLYCHADTDCVWELLCFVNHYHPSVALFARMLLSGQSITYSGDPLEDFTLMRFVDRFVYRNPKKVKERASSVQSAGMYHTSKGTLRENIRKIPVNSDVYLQKNIDQIPADELFFYKFFSRQSASKKLADDVDSDADDVSDDEFDEFLDKFEHGIADTDFDIDFATELDKNKCQKSKTAKRKVVEEELSSDEDDDDDDGEDNLSDEEVEFDDADFKIDFAGDADGEVDEFDEEQVEFSDEDDNLSKKSKKQKLASGKSKQLKNVDASLFAAADEFSHLMEDDAELGHMIGTQAVSRKDNAGMKQIKWEMDRDRWVKDKRWNKRHNEKRPKRGAKLKSTKK